MQNPDLPDWLALSLSPGLSARDLTTLITSLDKPPKMSGSSRRELLRAGIPDRLLTPMMNAWSAENRRKIQLGVSKSVSWQNEEQHNHIILVSDSRYPPLLKEIHDPPPVIYVKGDPASLSFPGLAMVVELEARF